MQVEDRGKCIYQENYFYSIMVLTFTVFHGRFFSLYRPRRDFFNVVSLFEK